ncbi:hypothetical protein PIB30_093236 [Stylosanthes scabra]|uniref:Uncharacterized protein n=1 Tax=Stylosanthes scabra TaxID=79078 RepID=A0ABU6YXU8_9FABA|nr:hypothetical protein [Stylosanthes scabra]
MGRPSWNATSSRVMVHSPHGMWNEWVSGRHLSMKALMSGSSTLNEWLHLPVAITFYPELRLTRRLRLRGANHVLYASNLRMRWCSSLLLNRASRLRRQTRIGRTRSSLVDLLETMRLMLVLGCSKNSGATYDEMILRKMSPRGKICIEKVGSVLKGVLEERPISITLNRFLPFRVDSGDELSSKKFSKCFESIRGVPESIQKWFAKGP